MGLGGERLVIPSERRKRRETTWVEGGGIVMLHCREGGGGAQGNSGHCWGEDSAIMSPILLTGAPV